jgi:hypothetical protein
MYATRELWACAPPNRAACQVNVKTRVENILLFGIGGAVVLWSFLGVLRDACLMV